MLAKRTFVNSCGLPWRFILAAMASNSGRCRGVPSSNVAGTGVSGGGTIAAGPSEPRSQPDNADKPTATHAIDSNRVNGYIKTNPSKMSQKRS
jgi:hypothetical protein